jgi:hypothetical protein
MRRVVVLVLALLAFLVLFGVGMTFLSTSRDRSNHAGCMNNLRALALLDTPFEIKEGVPVPVKGAKVASSVWPGTVPNAALSSEQRLSWAVLALPSFDEKLAVKIDRAAAWNAPPNREPGCKVLRTLICPAHVPSLPPGEPAPTMYVGIAGLGNDAATLPLTEPLSPRAGAFRYDAATPFDIIQKHDGVSQTFLFGQTINDIGPWIRGGPSTVRGLDDAANAKPILARTGGQFGGPFLDGSFFAFVDSSVRLFSYGTDPKILKSLATIAGGKTEWD